MPNKVDRYIGRFKSVDQHIGLTDAHLKKKDIHFVMTLSRIIETHPAIKNGRSKYVAEKSLIIAQALDMSEEEQQNLLYAGLLIQIGKARLPNKLLTAPFYSLSITDKYSYLSHAVEGETLLNGLVQFRGASILIRHQCERYDGQGFPDGLVRSAIPLASRIISVISDYSAFLDGSMTGLEMFPDAIINQLIIRKGSHYDPNIVDIFCNVLKEATVEELKKAIAKASLNAAITLRFNKGLLLKSKVAASTSSIVEIGLSQLKVGMRVDNIYFGRDVYIRDCIVDQSIIDNIIALQKNKGINPVIKIYLDR